MTHCVCAGESFEALLVEARRSGWTTLGQMEAATGCGARCGLCRPYLGAMLATGRTRFVPGSVPSVTALSDEWTGD